MAAIADEIVADKLATENMQPPEDLSAIEKVDAMFELVDAELIEDKGYARFGETVAGRVKRLLGRINSVQES